jgi:hypothetical protein
MDKPARRRGESAITEIFFMLGAVVVLVGLIFSIRKSWPAFDPLSLAMLTGIGLLMVVVCERLRILIREVQGIGQHLERMAARPEHRGGSEQTPAPR